MLCKKVWILVPFIMVGFNPWMCFSQSLEPDNFLGQMVYVLNNAIRNDTITILLCEIPEKSKAVANDSGIVPETQPNFTEVSTALSLAKLKVLDQIRGTSESMIFVQNLVGLMENYRYQPFSYVPGSQWILFLQSPLGSTPDGNVARKCKELQAETFLNDRSLFQIYERGFGAVCVKYPKSKEKPVSFITGSSTFADELKQIIQYKQNPANEPSEVFAEKLKDPLSLALFQQLK